MNTITAYVQHGGSYFGRAIGPFRTERAPTRKKCGKSSKDSSGYQIKTCGRWRNLRHFIDGGRRHFVTIEGQWVPVTLADH